MAGRRVGKQGLIQDKHLVAKDKPKGKEETQLLGVFFLTSLVKTDVGCLCQLAKLVSH